MHLSVLKVYDMYYNYWVIYTKWLFHIQFDLENRPYDMFLVVLKA